MNELLELNGMELNLLGIFRFGEWKCMMRCGMVRCGASIGVLSSSSVPILQALCYGKRCGKVRLVLS